MLSRLLVPKDHVEVRGQATTWGDWPGEGPAAAPVTVTTALQLLAVSGSVRLITDAISTLPVDVFSSRASTVEVAAPDWLLQPTTDLDFTAWCSQVLTSLLLHGNAYVLITRSPVTTRIVEMIPVDPSSVSVYRPAGGRKIYVVNGVPFPGELVHIKGIMLPGSDVGLSPLEYARQTFGLGLEALEFGADSLRNFNNMPGVIEDPGTPSSQRIIDSANAWKRARAKRNRGLPGYLTGGATWKPTGVTNEQAQFLETRQWTAAEIVGQVFLIDPREFGIPITGSTLDYTNAESRKTALLTRALLPWMIRIENAVSALLPHPRFMKFNADAFLRGDSAARWAIYESAMRINETAAALGQPPVLETTEMREFEDLGVAPTVNAPLPAVAATSTP
jgi:HK97 family phage portal protein